MKTIITICMLGLATLGFSQEKQPTFIAEGDVVKATYYYDDGAIKTQGYFKDKKLTGEWTSFDKSGNTIQLAYYDDGKKVGKWLFWGEDSIKEIQYVNNMVASVNVIKNESKVAFSNK